MKPETTEDTLIRVLLIVGLILTLLGCVLFMMLALGVDIAGAFQHTLEFAEKIVQYVKHLF